MTAQFPAPSSKGIIRHRLEWGRSGLSRARARARALASNASPCGSTDARARALAYSAPMLLDPLINFSQSVSLSGPGICDRRWGSVPGPWTRGLAQSSCPGLVRGLPCTPVRAHVAIAAECSPRPLLLVATWTAPLGTPEHLIDVAMIALALSSPGHCSAQGCRSSTESSRLA